ncbi:hypothetical protein PSPO01_10483 [Paraphaeosphaeria sporulosa]
MARDIASATKTWIARCLKPGTDLVHTLPVELLHLYPPERCQTKMSYASVEGNCRVHYHLLSRHNSLARVHAQPEYLAYML